MQDNTKIGYGKSIIEEFLQFIDWYYGNMPNVKIKVTDDYYILKYPSSNWYFNRENFRIEKKEIFSTNKIKELKFNLKMELEPELTEDKDEINFLINYFLLN